MKPKNKSNKPLDRKAVTALAYENAIKNEWHAGEAASWATKEYGKKIAKAEIQYYAMKTGQPYLDEINKMGIRMKTF